MPATASCRPPPLKSQWWLSRSGRRPSTINPPALPCTHRFHLTDQACPSKTFFNQHAKCCEPYLPFQVIFEPTCQAKHCDPVLSFLKILPSPQSHFWSNTPSQSMCASTVIPQHITGPYKWSLNQHAKRHEPFPSYLIILPAPPSHFWTDTPRAVSHSCHSSSDSLLINDSSVMNHFLSDSANTYYAAFFASCW